MESFDDHTTKHVYSDVIKNTCENEDDDIAEFSDEELEMLALMAWVR